MKYPTRIDSKSRFLKRKEIVSYDFTLIDYIENGYIIIRDFFNKTDIINCLHHSDNKSGMNILEPNINTIRSKTSIHEQSPFSNLIDNRNLIELVSSILGGGYYVHQSRINYKRAFNGTGWSWHSDFETWHSQDGMPEMRCVSAMIPLTENNDCNGSLMVIPKSHHYFYGSPKGNNTGAKNEFADQKEGVPDNKALSKFFRYSKDKIVLLTCKPGDLILFDCNLLHVSNPNMTSKDRTNLFYVFNSVENRLINPKRPEEMGATKINKVFI
jgi:ectoine hydroxylase